MGLKSSPCIFYFFFPQLYSQSLSFWFGIEVLSLHKKLFSPQLYSHSISLFTSSACQQIASITFCPKLSKLSSTYIQPFGHIFFCENKWIIFFVQIREYLCSFIHICGYLWQFRVIWEYLYTVVQICNYLFHICAISTLFLCTFETPWEYLPPSLQKTLIILTYWSHLSDLKKGQIL